MCATMNADFSIIIEIGGNMKNKFKVSFIGEESFKSYIVPDILLFKEAKLVCNDEEIILSLYDNDYVWIKTVYRGIYKETKKAVDKYFLRTDGIGNTQLVLTIEDYTQNLNEYEILSYLKNLTTRLKIMRKFYEEEMSRINKA